MPNPIIPGARRPNTPADSGSTDNAATTPATTTEDALPRTNNDTDTMETGGGGLGGFIRDHRRPAMAILGAAAAIPSIVGVAHAQPPATPDIESVDAPAVDLNAAESETFDRAKLKDYALYKTFWNSGNSADGTAHEGLDEVTVDGVDTLHKFALEHNLDGTKSAGGDKKVTSAEREMIKTILEDPDVGSFFELDALPKLYSKFGIPANTVHSVAEAAATAKASLANVLGIDANKIELSFPEAGRTAEMNYFSMDGKMATPMSHVDTYREALGLPKSAEAYEKAPVLGWMTGEAEGHTKHGSFSEKRPFSTSGLNWGPLIFPGDAQVAELPSKKGFDFPIDALTGFNRAVGGFASRGDTIVPVDKDGNELKVEKVIHKDADGKAVSWSATFKNADGEVVDAKDVTGLIKDRFGNTKGDGKTEGSMSMGWWGFCDRNTAGSLYKSKHGIPELDRDVRIEINGKTITIPKGDAQKLLDVDMTDMAGRTRFVGSRFNDEPMKFRLMSGESISGKIKGYEPQMGPTATRSGDNITVRNSDALPLLGSVEIKTTWGSARSINLDNVESITKNPDNSEVVIKMNNGRSENGTLNTELSFDGAEANADGHLVLKNSKDTPIIGEFVIDQGGGNIKRVKASEVKSFQAELQTEMSISEYVKFVISNKGMYATDNAKGTIVSNGMRWINNIDVKASTGAETPDWMKSGTKFSGIKGELVREDGDQILSIDGLYKTEWGDGFSSQFKGWIQLNSDGDIINEGFLKGEPDFGWAADSPLNWNAKSSFNPHMMPEMRMKMFVNGIEDVKTLEDNAEKWNLPTNWKTLRTPEAATTTAPANP
jgi:hypothetical protein